MIVHAIRALRLADGMSLIEKTTPGEALARFGNLELDDATA